MTGHSDLLANKTALNTVLLTNGLERLQLNLFATTRHLKFVASRSLSFPLAMWVEQIVFGRIFSRQYCHNGQPGVILPVVQDGEGKRMIHVRRTEQNPASTSL